MDIEIAQLLNWSFSNVLKELKITEYYNSDPLSEDITDLMLKVVSDTFC